MKTIFKKILPGCLLMCAAFSAFAGVEIYNYDPQTEISDRYEVKVGGKNVLTMPTNEPHVALFGTDKPVIVEVKFLASAPKSVEVRPLGKKYEYTLEGNVLKVKLNTYDRVSVEADGDLAHPLFIFVNPLEKKAFAQACKDPNTLVLKAGTTYEKNLWQVFDTYKHVYIQGGAIVKGFLRQDAGIENCSVDGCGVINARDTDKNVAFHIKRSDGFVAKNITVLNRVYWTFRMDFSDNFTVDNIKAVADCPFNDNWDENDAIHFVACTNGSVKHCFGYAWDDAYNVTSSFFKNIGPCFEIDFDDCIGWNVQPGNSFQISWSTKDDVHDIRYQNIYSIHSGTKERKWYRGAVAIVNDGPKTVSNISYDNVWIEDPTENAISLFILNEGGIHDISFKNIHILKPAPRGICIRGKNEEHKIQGVSFENLWYGDHLVTSMDDPCFHQQPYPIKFTENCTIVK